MWAVELPVSLRRKEIYICFVDFFTTEILNYKRPFFFFIMLRQSQGFRMHYSQWTHWSTKNAEALGNLKVTTKQNTMYLSLNKNVKKSIKPYNLVDDSKKWLAQHLKINWIQIINFLKNTMWKAEEKGRIQMFWNNFCVLSRRELMN